MTEPARRALTLLRDPSHFQWWVIPLFALVLYVYANEAQQRRWSVMLAGAAYFLMDLLWEVLNALLLHATGVSSLWVVTGGTSFLIFVGWSIEIALMFAIAGVVLTKTLPADRELKLFGLPNRWVIVAGFALFCAFVEVLLVQTPHFHWGYPWWNYPLVALIGYVPFEVVAVWVHDSPRERQLRIVGALAAIDLLMLGVFGLALGWI